MKYEKIKEGMTLYDVHKSKMGNTRRSSYGTYPVRVIKLDPTTRSATVSWNNNPPTVYNEQKLSKLKQEKPHLVQSPFSRSFRLETKEERKVRLSKENESNTEPTK
jgi:hypothetical protein